MRRSFWFKKLISSSSSKKELDSTQKKPRARTTSTSTMLLRISSWRPRRMSLTFFSFKTSSLLEDLSFRILSAAEAVVLVLTLSCFFLCCGCQF